MNMKNTILALALLDLTIHYTFATCILLALVFLWNSLDNITRAQFKIIINRRYLIIKDYLIDLYESIRYRLNNKGIEENLLSLQDIEAEELSLRYVYNANPKGERFINAHKEYCPGVSLDAPFTIEMYEEMMTVERQISIDLDQNPGMVGSLGPVFQELMTVVKEFNPNNL